MKPVVYIDVLFFVNLFINYILLFLTAKTIHLYPGKIRMLAGSALGALYSVMMFFPDMQFAFSLTAKILFSMAMVAVSYNIKGAMLYFKALGTFYLVTLALGGGVLALFYFTGIGARVDAVIKNGILYMNLPFGFLIFAVILTGAGIRLAGRSIGARAARGNIYFPLSIILRQKKVTLSALLDTGNTLREPISDYPVIIAEYEKLRPILPGEIAALFDEGGSAVEKIPALNKTGTGIRLIPFSSLGRENGMLVGFKPDSAYITENEAEREIGNIIVGIYNGRLAGDKSYSALLNPEII